jgi:hypothetical protein
VVGEERELSSIISLLEFEVGSSRLQCLRDLCSGELIETSLAVPGALTETIPVRAFYRAMQGFGVGEGDPASVQEFVDLMKNGKIFSVDAVPVGQPERVILRQLVMEDGTRLHFDSSARGACCFYIERPSKSCVEVVEDELGVDALHEGCSEDFDPHGKEAGRSPPAAEGVNEVAVGSSVDHVSHGPTSEPSGTIPMRTVR